MHKQTVKEHTIYTHLQLELCMSKEVASKAIQSARQMGTGSAHLQDLKGAAQGKQGWWLDGPLAALLAGLET